MHSLNLKGVMNFHSLSLPNRLSYSIAAKDCCQRPNRIVACGTQGQGPGPIEETRRSSFLSRTGTYALLKQQLENYKEAARLRDSLKLFEEKEPILRLRRLIKEAIVEERFEDAAKYRDELKEIDPHCLLKCSSDATTLDIRVQVRSVYVDGRSQPSKSLYFFAYRIRITNNSDRPMQLLRRHWIITDANGKTENVRGIGVIGEQPVLLPNTSFEYSSACPLSTPSGRMEGEFEMKYVDEVCNQTFNVAIDPFSLSTFGDGTDAV
ncbi:SKIP interacting protein 10 [Striga asiatica]|uniref:SKIP interacting protein 10 n=1 Tax=Striga asiatica TaxID=4170 RepID=A0A5A7P3A4_STRAF|nr:SKIP interacting protein 10 [Striga asiatica]